MDVKDEGFPSDRFGICVICTAPYYEGDRIGTAPKEYWHTSKAGNTVRLGHISPCILAAREIEPADAPRQDIAPHPKVACELCGHFYATVDMVIRESGHVQLSICGQCATLAVQDDHERIDEHARAFGKGRLTRVEK